MVSVTSHAKRRLKERCGVSKNSAMDMAERAFNKGISLVYIFDMKKSVIIFAFMATWFIFLTIAH